MKPLELTVYPLDPSFPAGYKLHRDTRITFAAANRMATEKRLTEPELAAELWRNESELNHISEGYSWQGLTGGWSADEDTAIIRDKTLERFATLPHCDEVPE